MQPWQWLNDNAPALQAVGGLTTLIVTVPVLVWTGRVGGRAAKAAEEQALAAQAQVAAAKELSRVSAEQLKAARDNADAEREHSRLLERQTLASLRPVLTFVWGSGVDESNGYLLNQSPTAIASGVSIVSLNGNEVHLRYSPQMTIIGPGMQTQVLGFTRQSANGSHMKAMFHSEDGREFITEATVDRDGAIVQTCNDVRDIESGPISDVV